MLLAMKNKTLLVTLLSMAAFTMGCDKAKITSQQIDKVQEKTAEAAQDMKDYTFAQKAEFVEKMQGQLAELNRDLDQLAAKIEMLLHRLGELGVDHARVDLLVILTEKHLEYLVEWVGFDATLAEHEGVAGGNVALHAGYARAVLAAVVLFFHQQEKLGETP